MTRGPLRYDETTLWIPAQDVLEAMNAARREVMGRLIAEERLTGADVLNINVSAILSLLLNVLRSQSVDAEGFEHFYRKLMTQADRLAARLVRAGDDYDYEPFK